MIFVAGFEPQNQDARIRSLIDRCSFVFASKRFTQTLHDSTAKLLPVVPIQGMIKEIRRRKGYGDILILASGDPLFFGIGRRLLRCFDKKELSFFPTLTSIQKACARFRLPWDDLDCVSLHGKDERGLNRLVEKILENNRFKVAVFTDNRNTPDAIAKGLMKMGLEEARFLVAEDMGGRHEAFLDLSIREAAHQKFHPLNLLIILGEHGRQNGTFGMDTDRFSHENGLITRPEVRAVILSRLELTMAQVLWDVGAGSGSVSIEASLLAPWLQIYSIESREKRCVHLIRNKRKFMALNMEIIHGRAPGCVTGLPAPDRIFIGGGLGDRGLLEACWEALRPGGILLASTILIESLERAVSFATGKSLSPELTRISIDYGKKLGAGNYFVPTPAISIIRICK